MRRILIVDDDAELAGMLSEYLATEGYTAGICGLGSHGAAEAIRGEYSLAVLDVMLPDMSGFDVLRKIRAESPIPIVMLTARIQELDPIIALEIGADDYVRKPFNPRELVARVHAVLRRMEPGPAKKIAPDGVLRVGDLALDQSARIGRRGNRTIPLTSVEFELLRMLLLTPGQVVAREKMFRAVLGRDYSPFDRSIDNHISALRRKLGKGAGGLDRIQPVRNTGYVYAWLHD